VLSIRLFDPIAEASELPHHSRSAPLLPSFVDGWSSSFVKDSMVDRRRLIISSSVACNWFPAAVSPILMPSPGKRDYWNVGIRSQ
jgi:hypothetical protein